MFQKQAVAQALLLIGEITGGANKAALPETAPNEQVISSSALGALQLPNAERPRRPSNAPSQDIRDLVRSNSSVESFTALSLPTRQDTQLSSQPMPPPRSPSAHIGEPPHRDNSGGAQFQLIAFQDRDNTPPSTPKPLEAHTEAELKQTLKEKMREYVFKMVNLYWKEHDLKTYGYWDQDGDGLADRLDQDSYNGHGVGKAYPKPIPGAREDGHYNCEYFAQNFWLAYRDLFYESNPKNQCWKLEYDGHATIAFYFERKGESIYVFLEPQGGSSWFISLPQLPLNEMPARGSSRNIRGIMCHNLEENSWTGVERFPGSKPLPAPILDQLLDGKPMPGNRPLDGTRTPGNRPVKAEEANNPNKK